MAELIRIVLVDDAPEVRSLVRTRLRLSKRFDVVGEGGTGTEAVALAAAHKPDVVLLDVSMPDMDGFDALTRIVEMAPDTKVVMLSGFEEHGLADRARELGATDFIEKSAPIDQLAERIAASVPGVGPVSPRAADGGGPTVDPILQEHLERFRAAFDQAAIGMATLTLTGRIVRANDAFERLLGAEAGALVGGPYEDAVVGTPELGATIAGVASGARDVGSVEHQISDGGIVVSTVAVVRDSARKPLYLFLQVQDVSARHLAEEQLRRSEERFRLLVEGVHDYAIFMLDPGGHIASWNSGAERAKGYTAEEILGKHFSTFYLPEAVATGHPEHELRVAVAEGRYEEEGWRVRKDGTTFWANVLITTLYDRDGTHIGFAKVTRDVTERRRLLQELEAAAADKVQLVAITAHELRNPVAVINGFAATLDDHWEDLEDAERREMLASIRRGGARLRRLVDDLLTAARLEAGALEVSAATFELRGLVEEAVGDLGLDVVHVPGPAVEVVGDRGRVHQMVSNYLSNAVRHGSAPITVEVDGVTGTGRLLVSDAGAGVGDALAPRLFDKFASGGSAEGTGLGLFIVRQLARAQGGDAWYEAGPSGGATFGMRLPLADR